MKKRLSAEDFAASEGMLCETVENLLEERRELKAPKAREKCYEKFIAAHSSQ